MMGFMRSVTDTHIQGQATQPLFHFAHIAADLRGNSPYCQEVEDIACLAQMGKQNITKSFCKQACCVNADFLIKHFAYKTFILKP